MILKKPFGELTLSEFSHNLCFFIEERNGDKKLKDVIIKMTEQYLGVMKTSNLSENYYKKELVRFVINYVDINFVGRPGPEWMVGIDELWKGFNLVE